MPETVDAAGDSGVEGDAADPVEAGTPDDANPASDGGDASVTGDGGTADAAVCGNFMVETGEDCDEEPGGMRSCAEVPGFDTGPLGCNGCRFDVSNCLACDPLTACAFPGAPDPDLDQISCDNCPQTPNAGQFDTDWDGLGDACDPGPNSAILTFETHAAPTNANNSSALTVFAGALYFFSSAFGNLYETRSLTSGCWQYHGSASIVGTGPGEMYDGGLAYDGSRNRLVMPRWRDLSLDPVCTSNMGPQPWECDRMLYFDRSVLGTWATPTSPCS